MNKKRKLINYHEIGKFTTWEIKLIKKGEYDLLYNLLWGYLARKNKQLTNEALNNLTREELNNNYEYWAEEMFDWKVIGKYIMDDQVLSPLYRQMLFHYLISVKSHSKKYYNKKKVKK